MTKLLDGFTPYRAEDAERYKRLGWWESLTFGISLTGPQTAIGEGSICKMGQLA